MVEWAADFDDTTFWLATAGFYTQKERDIDVAGEW